MGSAYTKTRLRSQLWNGIVENDHELISETVKELKLSESPIDITVTKELGDTVYSLASTQMKTGKVTMDTVKFLIKMGFDVNKKMESPLGFSPLYAAIRRNQIEMAQLLLEHGANPKDGEHSSDDAIFTACGMGYVDCVELLLKYNANPNSISSGPGGTPMMLTAQTSHINAPKITRLLIEYGADINYINYIGRNVLHTCADCLSDVTDTIQIYLDKGTLDVNLKDKFGNTPVHMAATANRPKIIQLLIQHGADPDITNNEGKTPLDLARKLDHEEGIKLFKRYKNESTSPTQSKEDTTASDESVPVAQNTSQLTLEIETKETVMSKETASVDQRPAQDANLIAL